jgi:hypothetical protein
MPDNAFIGAAKQPTEAQLAEALGSAKKHWDRLVTNLAQKHEVTEREWKAYSKNSGWTLRLKRKTRAIVYLSPYRGSFLAAFALGDRAVAAARASDLPEDVLQLIAESRRYVEGTAVRIEVRTVRDVRVVEKLSVIKLTH